MGYRQNGSLGFTVCLPLYSYHYVFSSPPSTLIYHREGVSTILTQRAVLYSLPVVPVVSAVNHVINYIPKLDLFLDSTSSFTPYGMLPNNLGEKPVLLVSNYREGKKTPSTAQYGHEQSMRTKIRINADGSAGGEMELQLKGLPAISARA